MVLIAVETVILLTMDIGDTSIRRAQAARPDALHCIGSAVRATLVAGVASYLAITLYGTTIITLLDEVVHTTESLLQLLCRRE